MLTGSKDGMSTLEQSLNTLVKAGVVSYDEAIVRSLHPEGDRSGRAGMRLGRSKAPEPEAKPQPKPAGDPNGGRPSVIAPVRPADVIIVPGGRRIGEVLVESNLVPHAVVQAALAEAQSGPAKLLGQRLIESGVLDERNLARVVAYQHSLEVVDLRRTTPDPEATKLLDEEVARRLVAIPLAVQNDTVVVADRLPQRGRDRRTARRAGQADPGQGGCPGRRDPGTRQQLPGA